MGALLVGLAAAGILMSAALPVWTQAAQREREAELVFRGEQYARAVALYQRTYAGAFPPDVETLIEERYLRRQYRDPMVDHGDFRILHESDAGDLSGGTPATERPGEIAEGREEATEQPVFAPAVDDRSAGSSEDRGGVVGVVSTSSETSLRTYNGATRYDQWIFLYSEAADAPGDAADTGAAVDPELPETRRDGAPGSSVQPVSADASARLPL